MALTKPWCGSVTSVIVVDGAVGESALIWLRTSASWDLTSWMSSAARSHRFRQISDEWFALSDRRHSSSPAFEASTSSQKGHIAVILNKASTSSIA